MSKILYNFSIKLYSLAIWIFSFFNEKAKKMVVGRIGIFEKLKTDFSENKAPIAWFHCASLGEFEQGRPIIEAFKVDFPEYKILLTFFSPSGYEIRKNYEGADFIFYLPLDTVNNVAHFLKIVNPKLAIFVKYEFWYNYINQLKINNIPTYLVSANFRENQIFFKKMGSFFRKIIFNFDSIFVQNLSSEKLLKSIGYENVTVAGDTRFDRVFQLSKQNKNLPIVEQFKQNNPIFVIGSAWTEDIDFLKATINAPELSNIKFIIAPHEIHESQIKNWQNSFLKPTALYSDFDKNIDYKVLIINNIGLLSSIYNYADFVWIGGAFGAGLHNILEAATFGKPIFFGNKNYLKFKEATDLIEFGGAFSFADPADFNRKFIELTSDKNYYLQTSSISKNYVFQNIGATEKIMNYLKNNLNPKSV